MITEAMGTVEKGELKLDQALPFADHTRVKLTIESVWDPVEARKAWERILAWFDAHPIVDGKPFTESSMRKDTLFYWTCV